MQDTVSSREQDRRLPIFLAAEANFQRYGFRKTTIEEICRDAGVSKRTFYELFSDKIDLVQQLLLHLSEALITQYHSRCRDRMTSLEKFRLFVDEYVRLGVDHPVFHILSADRDLLAQWGKLSDRALVVDYAPLVNLLKDLLEEGIDQGEFRQHDTDTATWIIYGVLKMMYFLAPAFKGSLPIKDPNNDSKIADELYSFLLHAIRSR